MTAKDEEAAAAARGVKVKRRLAGWWDSATFSLLKLAYMAPWYVLIGIFRLLYRFRVEGMENIPAEGPLLMVLREPTLIGVIVVGWICIVARLKVLGKHQEKSMAYLQDYLFALAPVRKLSQTKALGRYAGLPSHSAGRLALSLLDAYRVLRDGGVITLNPYGEGSWDGRPPPMGWSAAWLALRSAAPVMPTVCSIGAYDIWPRWQFGPSLRGHLTLRLGVPFRVCDTPYLQVSNEDLDRAKARIDVEVEERCYGPGGVAEWTGPVVRDGVPVAQPPDLPLTGESLGRQGPRVASVATAGAREMPVRKRGISQLLWRCPVCGRDDALVEEPRRFQPPGLRCQACETRWQVRRIPEKDFRLKVVAGPEQVVGLEMALARWSDEMMKGFRLKPIQGSALELLPEEQVYLEMAGASLSAERANALFEGSGEREPPQSQPPGEQGMIEWASLGEGRLILTSQRLVWQGPERELAFFWSSVTAVYLWMVNTLGLVYGQARYRVALGHEVGPKWLTYVSTLVRQTAEREGRPVPEAR